MTHKDIYTKFMIEYDKANVTSSYPSLTEYEVATVLDKAYYALIAQKITGNNVRRVGLEGDLKAVEDLRALITKSIDNNINIPVEDYPSNIMFINIPEDSLYMLQVMIPYSEKNVQKEWKSELNPIDDNKNRMYPVKQVSHQMAENFFASAYNIPWVKQPVFYLEDNKIYVVYDPIKIPDLEGEAVLIYIKKPNQFVKSQEVLGANGTRTYFSVTVGNNDITNTVKEYLFECNESVAEELVSLAVAFALENIESQRLNSKLNMRGLEA